MNSLISVIIPVYNVEKYICKCLDSVVNQTYKNLEIILVDDGSTDNSGKICDEYAAKDERIIVIHKRNGGLSDARNKGLDIAKGAYIGFVDSDDYIAEDMYEDLYTFACSNNLDVAMCASADVYEDRIVYAKNFSPIILETKEEIIENLFVNKHGGAAISVCNKLYKSSVLDNLRFKLGKIYEDAFFVLDWIANTKKFGRKDSTKYFYVQRTGSITKKTKFKQSILDGIEAYRQNLNIIRIFYPKVTQTAMYRLYLVYRFTIEKIYACKDYNEHKNIVKDLQKFIRENLREILKNKYITIKSKIAYIFLACNIDIYFYIKKKILQQNNK